MQLYKEIIQTLENLLPLEGDKPFDISQILLKLAQIKEPKMIFSLQKIVDPQKVLPTESNKLLIRQTIYQLNREMQTHSFIDLSDLVHQHAIERPDYVAIQEAHQQLTWSSFNEHVHRVANGLIALGFKSHDRIGVLGETTSEYLEIMLGCLRAGLCVVPLSSMASSSTLQIMGEDANLKIWFVSQKYRDLVAPFEHEISLKIALDFEAEAWTSYSNWRNQSTATPVQKTYDPSSQFYILYSSGTTGIPKGIIHSKETRYNRYKLSHRLGYTPEATTLVSTPLYSNTTMVSVLPTIAHAGKLVLMKKFSVEGVLEISQGESVTHAVLVPVQWQRIMAHPQLEEYDLSSFQLVQTTSAPLSEDLKRDIVTRWPGMLMEIYGMTEGGGVSVLLANEYPDKLHTVGFPMEGCVMKVIDEEGNELPVGEIGELVGYSDYMMDGYQNQKELTEAGYWYDTNGMKYQRSGDFGMIDQEGFVSLHGRKKEVIISGGFNVYAVDLEEILKKHPHVVEAAVIGIPSEKWGETPLGLVEIKSGIAVQEDDIKEWANDHLGKGQRLHAIEIREELPRSPIGKVLKKILKKPYWE